MTTTMMYWITRLDGIRDLLHGLDMFTSVLAIGGLFISCVTAIICMAMCSETCSISEIVEDSEYKCVRNIRNCVAKFTFCVFVPINILFSTAYVLTPSMKEYCAIKVVPAIMNNAKVQEFSDELYRLGVDWLKELRPQDKATSADSAKESVEPKQ